MLKCLPALVITAEPVDVIESSVNLISAPETPSPPDPEIKTNLKNRVLNYVYI